MAVANGQPFPRAPPAEDDSDATDTDDEGELIKRAAQLRYMPAEPLPPLASSTATLGGRGGGSRRFGTVTLKTLIDSGILEPGERVLYVEYKNNITFADLTPDGLIDCNGMIFESPSAFSIYLKRQVNPTRKADDGWKAVKYEGRLLESYKEEYLRQRLAAEGVPSSAPSATGTGSAYGLQHAPSIPSQMNAATTSAGVSSHTEPSPSGSFAEEESSERPAKRMRTSEGGAAADSSEAVDQAGSGAGGKALKIKIALKRSSGAPSPTGTAPGPAGVSPT